MDRNPKLVSKSFATWLDEPIFELKDGTRLARGAVASLTESPCTRAASNLNTVCQEYDIQSLRRLFEVGLLGLLDCRGVGERTAWVAACILDDADWDVAKWIDMKRRKVLTWRGGIKKAANQVAKRKRA